HSRDSTGHAITGRTPAPTDPPVRARLTENPEIQALAVSSDGSRVYTGERNGLVREWDTAAKKTVRSWAVDGWINDLALSPDNQLLAVTGSEGVCWVFNVGIRGPETPPVEMAVNLAGAHGSGVAFARDGPELAVATADGSVRVVHQITGQPIGVPIRFPGDLARIRFRPGTRELAVGAGGELHLCRPADPAGLLLNPGNRVLIRSVDIDRSGNQV